MNLHKSKTWIEKANKLKNGKVCEWCGSPKDLCVHHPTDKFLSPSKIRQIMNAIAYSRFKELYEEKYNDEAVKTGKHKHDGVPSYHPISTKHKFKYDISKEIIQYKRPKPTEKEKERFRKELKDFKTKNKINDKIELAIKEAEKRYVSLEDTVVLCKKCHFMVHRGYNLCPKCKKGYKKKNYPTCFNCLPEIKKQEIENNKNIMAEIEQEEAAFEKSCDDFL